MSGAASSASSACSARSAGSVPEVRARLSGRHRRFLVVEQGLVPGLINLVIAVVFTLVAFRTFARLPLWGRTSVGVDLLTTAVCLPLFTSLINSAMIRRGVRRGKILPLPLAQLPSGSWHLTSVVTRTLVLTAAVVVFAALPVLLALELTHTQAMDLRHYIELKAAWATLMALAIAPLIGWWALAQASAGLPAAGTDELVPARTVCNPLNLGHRFQDSTRGPVVRSASREAADPSLVRFQGRYYLFASMSGGFWHSGDLVDWSFVATPVLPAHDDAPDVREIDGQLVVGAPGPRAACSSFRTRDPLAGAWEEVPGAWSVGAAPLGPSASAPTSLFRSKPGGLMPSAGRGSTCQDEHGNWWHVASMRIAKDHLSERRLGLWPAGFDDDGVLFCNTHFGDYPMVVPDGPADPWSLGPRWMLLSHRRPVRVSSADASHPAELAVDEDERTWWVPADASPGHWLEVDLGEGATVHAVQLNLADHHLRPAGFIDLGDADPASEYHLEGSDDGETWVSLRDTRGAGSSLAHDYVVLEPPACLRFLRITGFRQPYGGRFAVSGLRVFGLGAGDRPHAVTAVAHRTGHLEAEVTWPPAAGADGYNVRYGLAPNRLYSSWLVHDARSLDLALDRGHDHWVAVDSFNACGISPGDTVQVR